MIVSFELFSVYLPYKSDSGGHIANKQKTTLDFTLNNVHNVYWCTNITLLSFSRYCNLTINVFENALEIYNKGELTPYLSIIPTKSHIEFSRITIHAVIKDLP